MAFLTFGWRVQGLDNARHVDQQIASLGPKRHAPVAKVAAIGQNTSVVTTKTNSIPWSHIFIGLLAGGAGYYYGKRRSGN